MSNLPLGAARTIVCLAGFVLVVTARVHGQATASPSSHRPTLERYCLTCHNQRLRTAGLTLDDADIDHAGERADVWEKVVRKLRTGSMPPPNSPQPTAEARTSLVSWLEASLDAAAAAHPKPGRTDGIRRLNRTEYQNAVRDLLAVEIDATALLPPDESGHGFDNVTVGDLSPALLDRYISAARKVSRLAVGARSSVESELIRVPPDLTQEEHLPGLPIGTRGGVSFRHTFVRDGEYELQVWLARNRTGNVGGLLRDSQPHQMQLLVDRVVVGTFTIQRPPDGDDTLVDRDLKVRATVTAGPHEVGITFLKSSSSLLETARQPLQAHFNENRHPRITPALAQVSVTGPYAARDDPRAARAANDTPSRQQVFVCRPSSPRDEDACAKRIVTTLMRRAYRRPVGDEDVARAMTLYREGRSTGDFDAGIEHAVSAVLVSPEFLFRVEVEPQTTKSGLAYRISDLELASRLSFFVWSSVPDDELLGAAIKNELHRPEVLERQVRRMLADPRSYNLASNFAGQWLRLRNLTSVDPNARLFPDFDDNLRQAFRLETELLFDSVVRENRSVLDLLRADYTFLNERLAKHYGIAGVYGTRFRRVTLDRASRRGGLLRHGSVLSVTAYATRTSPVIRGVWVLDNILGAPPPPPPPNVPALDENAVAAGLPMRERLAAHRRNAVCATCHRTIDPVGFSLENFDAVGRWRDHEGDGGPVDVSGGLPGAGDFKGIDGLESALLARPELFASRLVEKLMVFALGRGSESYDAPALRQVVRDAERDGYRFSSLVLGIVKSVPFQMRTAS